MDDSQITYYKYSNQKLRETWYNNDQIHRLGGPADIDYYENGAIKAEHWLVNGRNHRFDGPAHIHYSDNNYIISNHWWINGEIIETPFDNYPLTHEQLIEMKLTYG